MTMMVRRWHGETWTALLSQERYGLHFSVGGQGREPTDQEVQEARRACPSSYRSRLPITEVTSAHRRLGAINPHVRHYVPPGQAARFYERAAEAHA
jgi:hypothetical protein